ncbi:MAG: ABC transporter substrate-binding protein [Atribacterota bacterium]|nr:ABC transporter substrate-binding protein [Atribacterota bacterium]MDD4896266.1 ABC transporter substrate-binding protein [Atribacterota bacterium]MDD5637326.1 ABC transporter substrate-binding protein [Atribacterota bacterium]
MKKIKKINSILKNYTLLLILVAITIFFFFASSVTAERTVTITDMSGDTVTITGEVKRIVNLWPAGTSSFFVMGAGELIVGLAVNNPGTMNSWTQLFYPDCVNIPALGGITPSIENLINLEPDLVIIHPTTAASGLAQQIRDVGIPAININFSDYATMIQAYTILGEVLGGEYQDKLNHWCSAVEIKLEKVREVTSGISENNRPVVYYIAGQTSSVNTTMAAGSIISDWIGSAGGNNAAEVMKLSSGEVTPEAIWDLNPDLIICAGVYQHVNKNALENTDGWKDLKALSNNRLYTNPYGCFNWDRFGLESQLQIHYALMCIQPEIAKENGITRESMINEIIDFYKHYTNFELNQTQAEYMLDGLRPDGSAEFPVQ